MSQLALYSSGGSAPPVRTLVDVLAATTRDHPDAPALDDGRTRLTYRALRAEVQAMVAALGAAGIGRGDRVGVRVPSGTVDLYIAILGVLEAGAAYVPVDADDPEERARLVFGEAGVRAVIGAGRVIEPYLGDPVEAETGAESDPQDQAKAEAELEAPPEAEAGADPQDQAEAGPDPQDQAEAGPDPQDQAEAGPDPQRSEERRVGKEC